MPIRGVLMVDLQPVCLTLELPWQDNRKGASCIPKGEYTCRYVTSRRTSGGMLIKETFQVMNVPKREGILFHVGNTAADTQGCILVGTEYGTLGKSLAILNSKQGFKDFLISLVPEKSFLLSIEQVN